MTAPTDWVPTMPPYSGPERRRRPTPCVERPVPVPARWHVRWVNAFVYGVALALFVLCLMLVFGFFNGGKP